MALDCSTGSDDGRDLPEHLAFPILEKPAPRGIVSSDHFSVVSRGGDTVVLSRSTKTAFRATRSVRHSKKGAEPRGSSPVGPD
jgi:hypothetical protein